MRGVSLKKQFLFVFTLVFVLFLSSAATANAAQSGINPEEMAVFLNNGFTGQSTASVKGSICAAKGNVEFDNSSGNEVTGNIYINQNANFTIPQWYNPSFKDRVVSLPAISYEESYPDLAGFPNTDGYTKIDQYVTQYNTPDLTVSDNTYIKTVSISNDKKIIADTSKNDVILVIDDLTMNWNSSINVSGNGKLILFIGNYHSAGPIVINNGNNPDKTYIYAKTSISHTNMNLYAHVFYDSSISSLNMLGTITGSVVTNAKTLTLSGGNNVVNGLLYAPQAAASISSPNSTPNITGRLVADSLNLKGSGKIVFGTAYTTLEVPSQFLEAEAEEYAVTIQTNIEGAGSVSPASSKVTAGQTIHITATANPGYRFLGFSSNNSSMIPDANGNLTVTGPVVITASFELINGDYVNGLLGEYYDASEFTNDSALKIRRIDPNIAFNFGYDSPDAAIEPETFAIKWTGFIKPAVSGNYIFKTYSDDGVVVNINGTKVIDRWGALSLDFTIADSPIYLEAGKYYPITVEYQQLPIYAATFLFWQAENVPMSLVPDSSYYVTKDVYTTYASPQYYNPLSRTGKGFHNEFYSLSGGERAEEYSETNNIVYDWGDGAPEGITTDEFYGEMSGYLEAKYTEATTLEFLVDDGIRVWVGDEEGKWYNNGDPVIDQWDWNSVSTFDYTFDTVAGHKYKVRIEYVEKGIGASCIMRWKGDALGMQDVPKEYMYTDQ